MFVESYGRVAVEDPSFAPASTRSSTHGDRQLAAAGYQTRSAFLTSPTFGAASWLAHATLQSGLWVDSQRRYDQLLDSDRLTLTDAFERAGWRTVFDVPANTRDWPEGAASTGSTRSTTRATSATQGPEFGYAPMPDQYTLDALPAATSSRRADRPPVMAEIDLVSSHHPWAPLPRLGAVGRGRRRLGLRRDARARRAAVDGDGDPEPAQRSTASRSSTRWRTLVSLLETYPDPDLVLVVLGDHQPHSVRQRRRPRPRRTDLGHRPGPGRRCDGSRTGTGSPACTPTRTPRSGRWTRSATGCSPSARVQPGLTAQQDRRPVGGLDHDLLDVLERPPRWRRSRACSRPGSALPRRDLLAVAVGGRGRPARTSASCRRCVGLS